MATKVAQQRNEALRMLKSKKETLTKKEVLSKIKGIQSNADILKEFKLKAIPIPRKPVKAIDIELGDITKLSAQHLGQKYASFVEYSEYIGFQLGLAEVENTVGEIVSDHTEAVIMLEDTIQLLTSREDRDAAVKSHKEVMKTVINQVESMRRFILLRAIFNGLIRKVDALSREITRRGLGSEKHSLRVNKTY